MWQTLDPDAGHWSIRPTGDFEVTRRYLAGTLVLETTFTTRTGSVRLLDALAFAEGSGDTPSRSTRRTSCSVRWRGSAARSSSRWSWRRGRSTASSSRFQEVTRRVKEDFDPTLPEVRAKWERDQKAAAAA